MLRQNLFRVLIVFSVIVIPYLYFAHTTYAGDNGGSLLDFDGVNDYINVPDSNSLDLGNGDMTVEAWVRTTQTSHSRIFTKGGGGCPCDPVYQISLRPNGSIVKKDGKEWKSLQL